jgi:hypothetical protein
MLSASLFQEILLMQDMDANALNQTLLSYMEKQNKKSAQFARMPLQTPIQVN